MRKQIQEKFKLKESLQSNWLVLFRRIKVVEEKERQKITQLDRTKKKYREMQSELKKKKKDMSGITPKILIRSVT